MKFNFKADRWLAITVGLLVLFGMVMITSIGVPKSIALSAPDVLYPSCSDANVDCYMLAKNHFFRLLIALFVAFLAFLAPIKFWRKMAPLLFGAVILALLVVMILGNSYGTIATSWLVLFNTSLQPSEFAKIALVLYLAYWLSRKGEKIKDLTEGVIPFCITVSLVLGPIVLQNDYGSALVIGGIAMGMFILAGAKAKHVLASFLVAIVGFIIVVAAVPHVQERIQGFTRIDQECIEDYCWQSQQAAIAIGSGGFWGKGLTLGVQKSLWLPQASDDFIFAASAEELGFIKIIFVVIGYFIIAWRGYTIASKTEGTFEMLIAVGITTAITFQAFVNIAVNTALFPVTGITLPFISYGGSSLVASLVGVAILLKISENSSSYAYSSNRGRDRRSRVSKYSRYRRD
ncbi:hypothetical protein CVV38_01745 [Candidatus Peregrinibacteria bacterium HGW-Peregrinibacteria-1]|jgi:cell division protein FtsW|nr:MAG: hypothetical protein CVV38_01745 [Candidatus Peregrinibacteria bacterium HGW-Peregrinibacteria-1]